MAQKGIFISFEGIDGAGKSSHIGALADAFAAQGRVVVRTREPGGTPLAEKLRDIILHDSMDALTEALLVFAARRDHIVQVIVPALARGDVVLCDRFTDASFAYQGAGRGFGLETLSFLERLAQEICGLQPENALKSTFQSAQTTATNLPSTEALLQPHLTIWFDVPPAIAAARLATARTPDKFESQSQAFFERVVQGYEQRADADPLRFARIDGNRALEEVRTAVLACVQGKRFLS